MPEQNSACDVFVLQAQQAAEKPDTTPRENYKTAVDRILTEKPSTSTPDLLRGVLRALGFESSGADAMTDDELLRVVLAGRTVIRLHRAHNKKKKEGDNV